MPQDPLARMGLSRSPIAKLFKPTPEQMEEPQMTEDMRSFAIQQQAIDTQLKNLQKQNVEQQNALAAEQAAQQYYQQPASARERFLEENQQALGASTGAGIYRGQMLQQRQATLSDKTLAPHIAKSIPIEVRGEYWNRVTAGQSPTEAKDAVEVMAYNRDLRSKLAEVMSPEEINKKYGSDAAPLDPAVITYEISQRKSTGSGRTDPKMEALDRLVRLTTDRAKSFMIEGVGAPTKPKDPVADPEGAALYEQYSAAKADADKYTEAYRKYLSGIGMPELEQETAPPPAAAGAVTPPAAVGGTGAAGGMGAGVPGAVGVAPAGKPFTETMKQLAGGVTEVLPKLSEKEELELVSGISDSPEALIGVIRSDQKSLKAKEAALKKLQEFEKKLPNFVFTEGTPQQIEEIKQNLPQLIEEAKNEINLVPVKRMVDKAWETEKNNISSQIEAFAKAIRVSPKLAEEWIANDTPYTTQFDPTSDTRPRTVGTREYFGEFLQNMTGKGFSDEADILKRFTNLPGEVKVGAWRYLLGKGKTYEDILDAYLFDKKPSVAGGVGKANASTPQAAPVGELNIKKVTIKTP